MTQVERYKKHIANSVSSTMRISYAEARQALEASGVSGLIDEDPPMNMHYDVSEWADDVCTYILHNH